MSIVERGIKELLNKYKIAKDANPKSNAELEIRFGNVTRELFTAVYEGLSGAEYTNPHLELTINVISENIYEKNVSGGKTDDTTYIRRITYSGGDCSDTKTPNVAKGENVPTATDDYYSKQTVIRPVRIEDYINYSVSLSLETPISKFSTSMNATLRFKLRVSFDIVYNQKQWRIDMSAVKHGQMNEMSAGNLSTIKQQLYPKGINVKNFLSEINYAMIDSYEIELEYMDKSLPEYADLAIAKKIFTLANPKYLEQSAYQDELMFVADYIVQPQVLQSIKMSKDTNLKRITNQAVPLTRNLYYTEVYPMENYLLTIKADGERALVVINGNRCRILTTEMHEILNGGQLAQGMITICDCEILMVDGKTHARVFDVALIKNENISMRGLEQRILRIDDAVSEINRVCSGGTNYITGAIPAVYETSAPGKLKEALEKVYKAAYKHKTDGIMMSTPGKSIAETVHYKWKPYTHNTIDFLAIKCPKTMLGIEPYIVKPDHELYLLFVGISHQQREKLGIGILPQYKQLFTDIASTPEYYPVQFSPSFDPLAYIYYSKDKTLDRVIVELGRDAENTHWVFHRVRDDRTVTTSYYGNNWRTAEITYLNYIDPFHFENLYNPASSYFTKNASTIHNAPNKYKRFIISRVFKNHFSGAKWMIDEAAGRGADMFRYQEINVGHVLFIDVDAMAISELITRKFSAWNRKEKPKRGGGAIARPRQIFDNVLHKDVRGMTVHTMVADLKTPRAELIAKTYQYGVNPGIVDGIVCNFALHYMCDTIENLRNLLMFNASMLKINGTFFFTVMDGKAIFDLLVGVEFGKSWSASENNVVKYEIKKDYQGKTLAPVGQMISVRLPFIDDLVSEPLCNVDVVVAEAAKLGLMVEINDNMAADMSRIDKHIVNQLTAEDKHYIGLFRYITLRKTKEVKFHTE